MAAALLYGGASVLLLFLVGRRRSAEGSVGPGSASIEAEDARPSPAGDGDQGQAPDSRRRRPRRFAAMLAAALVLSTVEILVLARAGGSWLGAALWVGSLLALAFAGLGVEQRMRPCLRAPGDDPYDPGRPRPSAAIEATLMAIILLAALWLRVVDLETHPGIHGDEGERGIAARNIVEGQPIPFFGFSWGGVPAPYFYGLAPLIGALGSTMFAIRLFSVGWGLAAVWLVYRIGRRLWGVHAGLIAGGLLAVLPIAIHFSRHAGESTPTQALWAAGFLFVCRALRGVWRSDWLLAGLCFGLTFYFYVAGRLVVLAIGILMLYCLARWGRRTVKGWGLFLLAFLLTVLPQQVVSRADGWGQFFSRASETSITTARNRPLVFARHGVDWPAAWSQETLVQSLVRHPLAWTKVGLAQLETTAEVLYRHGDPTAFYSIRIHGGSLLSPALACLTLLGIAWAVLRVADARYVIALTWLLVGLLPAAVTMNTPSVQRLTGVIPVLMLFPAVLLDRIAAAFGGLNARVARVGGGLIALVFVIAVAVGSWREYFVHYRGLCPHCEGTAQARHVQSLGQEYRVYQLGMGQRDVSVHYGSTKFVAGKAQSMDVTVPSQVLPITDNGAQGAAFLVYSHNAQYLPLIQLFHPGGQREDVTAPDGAPLFVSYRLSAAEIDAGRMVEARYQDAGGVVVERREPSLGGSGEGAAGTPRPGGLTYPVRATWSVGLMAPQYGLYTFATNGAVSELAVDGRRLIGRPGGAGNGSEPPRAVEVILARGLHEVRLEAQLAAADSTIGLVWTPPRSAPASLPSALLYQGPVGGLAGEIWTGVGGASLASFDELREVAPVLRQSDPFIGFHALTDLTGGEPLAARWRGKLVVPAEGKVVFEIRSNGPAQLLIDGAALSECPAGGTARDEVQLTAGAHDVELRYAWTAGRARLEWFWTPPGEGRLELVPPTALRPGNRVWLRGEIPDPPRLEGPASANLEAPLLAAETLGGHSGLSEPRGVGVDSLGRVFVGDTGHHRVVRIENDKVSASWGRRASEPGPGRFGALSDLAVAADGHVATVDQQTGDVTLFDADGKVGRYLQRITSNASGIALDDAGAISVADTGNSRILRVGPDGVVSIWTGEGGGFEPVEQPLDVVVDDQGVVYAVDLRRRIVRFAADGRIDAQWNVEIGLQRGGSHLASSEGRVLMTLPDRGLIVVLDPATGGLRHLRIEPRLPLGIDAGADGRTYVVDSAAGRVHVYTRLQ